jgi:sulfur carrier protein
MGRAPGECYRFRRMHVTVNGEDRDVPDGLSVRGLIEALGLVEGPVAVEKNREIVPRAMHAETPIRENDVLEIVHLVGGG